jgi:3-oxoacyl-[acyl-carrier protein] reductase
MDLGLDNKRALVLGASRGLGAAISASLAREGAQVISAARNQAAIVEWTGRITSADARGRIAPAQLDLADLKSVDRLADEILAAGGVDILVNNSPGPPPGEARAVLRDAWLAQFETMAASLFHLTRRLLPPMVERKWGRIITVVSSGVDQPIPRLALSNGIRAAVVGWSKTLAAEVASAGITVNVVLPGRIATQRVEELDKAAADREGRTVSEVVERSMSTIPVQRYGAPEEFADVVAFLASARASYVTGAKIRVDGGLIRSL